MRKPVLVRDLGGKWGDMYWGWFLSFFLIVHFFRGCCGSMRQVVVGGEGMDGRGVPAEWWGWEVWQEVGGVRKYKNRTGNWEIFSWKEPTGGKGAFTCTSCTVKCWKKSITCGSCTGDVLEKILFLWAVPSVTRLFFILFLVFSTGKVPISPCKNIFSKKCV